MARDRVEVELQLNAKRAEATIRKMNRELDKMGKTMGKAFSGGSGGGVDKVRALGTGLSKATVRADEFNKSLEASNARVIAFGASAGLIMNVERAMRAMVKATIQVEKAMADVNVVMNASTKQLDQFGKGMFRVAKETAQGFGTVAEAATELARQGLGMEKTLNRTKDALILTRLTGMNAADAVKSLTAAVNSFNKEGVTSAQVVNRMAKVDAAFAVSSEDLANSIARVGASAQSAGVSMNELMAITTAVQQRTARGGAVIGNAFKTIFTRIQRSDVQQRLENIGVATRGMNGEMLSGIQVLQNLAKNFNTLTKSQQASTAESVAGVFQVNILKSALADLSQQNSAYAGALRAASSATDEAYQKNEKLNKTLDSLVNRTMANLTQAGASLGGDIFGPAIGNVLGAVNSIIDSFKEGGKLESFGEGFGKDIVKGIGKFIGGPGLVLITAVFSKLALSLGKFASAALKDMMGLNAATKQRAALEEIVVNTIAKEPTLLKSVKAGTLDVLSVEKQILATIKAQQAERAALGAYGGALATSMYGRGARVGASGRAFMRGGPGKAGGFVPNFANPNTERAAAAAGGYTAGAIKTMRQPGAGTMMYNSAETVKQFPGMSQKAIMPPKGSPAGAAYKSAFGAAHGFNPYAAGGFVPNYSKAARGKAGKKKIHPNLAGHVYQLDASDIGVILGLADGKVGPTFSPLADVKSLAGLRNNSPKLYKDLENEGAKVRLNNIRVQSFINTPKEAQAEKMFEALLTNELESGTGNIAKKVMTRFGIEGKPGRMGPLPAGLQGEVFEEAMRMAMKAAVAIPGADFDFEAGRPPSAALQKIFGQPVFRIDAKRRLKSAQGGEMPKKYFNDSATRAHGVELINLERKRLTEGKALGYVPNFTPLSSAIGREMAAGVPASAIRVGSSPSLRGAGNPRGLGVYNTIDEPRGLSQGINRSRSMGINPKSHGVPNFAAGLIGRAARGLTKAGKAGGGVAGFGLMGASDSPIANILGSGLMGLSMGPKGALGMMAITTFTEILPMLTSSSDDATDALKAQIEAQNQAIAKSMELTQSFADLAGGMSATEFTTKKAAMLTELGVGEKGNLPMTHPMANSPELKALIDAGPKEFKQAQTAFNKRLGQISVLNNLPAGNISSLMQASKQKTVGDAHEEYNKMLLGQEAVTQRLFGMSTHQVRHRQINEGEKFTNTPEFQEYQKFLDKVRALDQVSVRGVGKAKPGAGFAMQAGEDFLKRLGGQAGMSQREVMARLAAAGTNPADMAKGGVSSFRGGTDQLAKILGVNPSDLRNAMQSDEGGFFQAITGEARAGNITREERDKALRKYVSSIIAGYTDQEAYNKAVKENEKIEAEAAEKKKTYTETLLQAMKQQESYRQSVFNAKRALDKMTRDAAQGRAIFGLGSGLRTAQANARMNSTGVAGVVRNEAIAAARLDRRNAEGIAAKALEVSIKEGLAGMNAVKFIEGKGFGGPQAGEALAAFTELRDQIKEGADQSQIDKLIERLAGVKGLKLEQGILSDPGDQVAMQELPKIIDILRKAQEKYTSSQDKAIQNETNAINLAKEQYKVTLQTIKLQYELNTAKREEQRMIQSALAEAEYNETRDLAGQGRKGMRDVSSAYSAALAKNVESFGVEKGDFGRAFRAGFINEMGYNEVDALRDFENGSRQVAQTMKSSFADAFQSISSGASSVQGALANMAQSILNSINQMSSQMFTNMLFSRMMPGAGQGAYAQGGYVPGYAGGGLVTGGSGYKDDVLTRMSGGEFVIKKSAVNKIGVGTLNAINGYANGGNTGPGIGTMGLIAAGSGALSGVIQSASQPKAPKPIPSRDYGMGRSSLGYLGGADPDAGRVDSVSGGGGAANVSLAKGFVYYRRDPETGRLVSERARPTEGRFEVSDSLSLMGRLNEGDPQTARMFEKEQRIASYMDYVAGEKASRRNQIKAVEKEKRGRMVGAFMNAAMLVGGAKIAGAMATRRGSVGVGGLSGEHGAAIRSDIRMAGGRDAFAQQHGYMDYQDMKMSGSLLGTMPSGGFPKTGNANGGLARVMGGEYIMSPQAVRTHGVGFMTELNRGNVPRYAGGGLVGNQTGPAVVGGGSTLNTGGNTTNNVKININVDKSGGANAEVSAGTQSGSGESARDENEEIQNNSKLGDVLQGVVLEEIIKQQRPGGLLHQQN
tara:strand:+ start:2079 stop:8579 length:6501 start_codon:yes stop_codon:yes gene_type:complete